VEQTRRDTLQREGLTARLIAAHDAIRAIDGLHADQALDELCKVLATRRGRDGRNGRSDASRLSTPARARVAELLPSSSRARDADAGDLLGRAFEELLEPAARSGMGQYFTPAAVARLIVEALAPRGGESLLDPFCGSGRFLAARETMRLRRVGIEKSDRMVRVARTGLALRGLSGATIHEGDALSPFAGWRALRPASFDLVATNPPFGASLGRAALDELGPFELARGRASAPLELLGLERSVAWLKPGGLLAIVLPESVLSNPRLQHARDWLLRQVELLAIAGLPLATFVPFGANVRTSIVFARKRTRVGEAHGGARDGRDGCDERVLLLSIDDVGHDATGRATGRSDLAEAATAIARVVAAARGTTRGTARGATS
jgi:type I restriction enzyme M protein